MKFHVTQEKHVLQSDECVFEMNTKKENVSRLTINHHILFTKTDNHVENHVEGQFPIKNTRSLKALGISLSVGTISFTEERQWRWKKLCRKLFQRRWDTTGFRRSFFQLEHLVLNSSGGNFGKLFFSSFAEKFPNGILLKWFPDWFYL